MSRQGIGRRGAGRQAAHGEIWWLEDRDIGRRPVLVLTRDSAVVVLTGLVVAPITRTIRGIPTEIELDSDDGMAERCAVTLDNLRTVPKALLTRRIAALSVAKRLQMCEALRFAVDC